MLSREQKERERDRETFGSAVDSIPSDRYTATTTPAVTEDKEGADSRARERAANFSREKGTRTGRSDRDNWRDKSSGSTSSENVNSGATSSSLNGEKEQRKFERKERPISSTSQWKNERDSGSSKDRSSDNLTSGATKLSPKDLMWEYLDPQGEIQGPFGDMEMNEWYEAGFFTPSLLVKRVYQPQFTELDVLISAMDPNSNRPFFTPASMLSSLVTPYSQKEKDVDSAPEKQVAREEKAWSKNNSKQSISDTPPKVDSQASEIISDSKENDFQEVKSKRGNKSSKHNANLEPSQNTSTGTATSTNVDKNKKKVTREEDILVEKFGVTPNATGTSSTTSVVTPPKSTTSPAPPQVNIDKPTSAVPVASTNTTNAWGVVSSSAQVAPVSITMQLQPQLQQPGQTQLKRKEGVFVIDESKGTAVPVQMPMQIPQGTSPIPVIQQQVPSQRQSIPPSQAFHNPPMYPFVPQPVPVCLSLFFTHLLLSPNFLNTISLLLV